MADPCSFPVLSFRHMQLKNSCEESHMNIWFGYKESISDFYVSDSDQEYVPVSPLVSNQRHIQQTGNFPVFKMTYYTILKH